MKKSLLVAAMSLSLGFSAAAQDAPSASTTLYDFAKYDALEMVKYFKTLNDEGRKFPTSEEFKAKFGVDPELIRSHVRKRKVLMGEENNTRLFPSLREGRTVFLNLPLGTETQTGGYPSAQFDNDPFTLWQYADLYGAWNHGFFQAPGSWADAAHKHGVDMMSGIVFFDTTGNPGGVGSETFVGQFLKYENGEYTYLKPLIHILMYLGLDGINYNWEASGYTDSNVVNFHKGLRNYAKEIGFDNYRQAIYTSRSSFGSNDTYMRSWLWDTSKNHHIGDIMLNYSSGDFASGSAATSAGNAHTLTGSYDHFYNGAWIVTMNRRFAAMEAVPNNICLWGEHGTSRFVSNNTGNTATEKMANLQELFERAFSGGNRNPGLKQEWSSNSDWGNRLQDFGGISRMIPERTTLKQNLPFRTNFNTGGGERYFYKGKSASHGSWYNMASQDLQPTFRWLQYEAGTKTATVPVQVEYTYEDAYLGGSSLLVSATDKPVDLILYRGLLTVGDNWPKATLAFKAKDATKTKKNPIQLILHRRNAGETEYLVYDFQDLTSGSWEAQTVELSGLNKGDVIDFIGVRVKAKDATASEHKTYLGELYLHDDRIDAAQPSKPKNLRAEVKMETQKSLSVLLAWDVDALNQATTTRNGYGLVYNDEAGVHHFEILYKQGENGEVRELARTTSWGTYVPTVAFEKSSDEETDQPYFGVRAVGEDLKTVSEVQWIAVERQPSFLLPEQDRYCKSYLNPKSENAHIARDIRYLQEVKTTGAKTELNYTASAPDADGDNYVYAKNQNLVVEQGKEIEFYFKAYGDQVAVGTPTRDGLQWCWAATYIDWNNDGVFDALGDEKIAELALGESRAATPQFQTTGVRKKFTIPADARRGKVRVRVVFTDAWFPEPTPCALTAKGFTFDFDMTIEGTNSGRDVVDPRDAGEPEQPENLSATAPTSVEEVLVTNNYSSVYPNPATSVLNFSNTDRAWIYTLDGRMVRFVADASSSVDISGLSAGTYIVKTERANVTRSHKVVKQ